MFFKIIIVIFHIKLLTEEDFDTLILSSCSASFKAFEKQWHQSVCHGVCPWLLRVKLNAHLPLFTKYIALNIILKEKNVWRAGERRNRSYFNSWLCCRVSARFNYQHWILALKRCDMFFDQVYHGKGWSCLNWSRSCMPEWRCSE